MENQAEQTKKGNRTKKTTAGREPTDLKQLYKIHHNGYYTSEWMQKLWGHGQIQIAQAVPETYRYVAGYVTKKCTKSMERKQILTMN